MPAGLNGGESLQEWPDQPISCGEATIRLLAQYGVDTVFGIPGVHTLEFYRGLARAPVRHVLARTEQGAGFMADGYARASGRPGVALVISGPGVTNALTPVGQSFADSIPVLLLSSETDSGTHGKGWGALHEIPDQRSVTAPMTALSLRASNPADVPGMVAEAFGVFASERPRPVHLSIPIDVLATPVSAPWSAQSLPHRPLPNPADVELAVARLRSAHHPVVIVGGGARGAADAIRRLVDSADLPVIATTAGKGIVPDDHPLALSATLSRPEVQAWMAEADVVLAVGTELAETDTYVERLELAGDIIRIDIDPRQLGGKYSAAVGIVADAAPAVSALLAAGAFSSEPHRRARQEQTVAGLRTAVAASLTHSERSHAALLGALAGLGDDVVFAGDICQLVYTGAFALDRRLPGTWWYPAGFCTLGCALPDAIGAKLADPDRRVVCLAGDGGVMFTIQELITAAELGLGIPIVVWVNGGFRQIRDEMEARGIPPVAVAGRNPDFAKLADSMGADAVVAKSLDHTAAAVAGGFAKDRPTVIVVAEDAPWLE